MYTVAMLVGFTLMMEGYDVVVYVTSFLYTVELKLVQFKVSIHPNSSSMCIYVSSCQIFTALTKHLIPPNMLLVSLSLLPNDIWHFIMHLLISMPDN